MDKIRIYLFLANTYCLLWEGDGPDLMYIVNIGEWQ